MMNEPLTIAFFGISGSGKGTQCAYLEDYLKEHDPKRGVVRPEMGNLLRSFMTSGTSLADLTGRIVSDGGLVPSFMPIHLLTAELNEKFDGSQHLILDGTCRRPDQSRAVHDMMQLFGRKHLQAIVLTLTREAARQRLIARGRADDATEEALNNRFTWYEEQVVPSIDTLRDLGWTIHEMDGSPDIETVNRTMVSMLGLA